MMGTVLVMSMKQMMKTTAKTATVAGVYTDEDLTLTARHGMYY